MQARRARVRQIRRTVTAAAVVVFLALFATIYIQMAVGQDPALGSSATGAQVSETSTSSATSTSPSSSDDDEDDDASSGTMTTAQS
jgi:hypothetical protein